MSPDIIPARSKAEWPSLRSATSLYYDIKASYRFNRQRKGRKMKIYLFRHGETDWNKERRLQGQSDIPLNDYGRALAEETAAALSGISFDKAFCSPLRRAAETAEIIAGKSSHSLFPIADERLMEIHFGQYEGHTFDDMKQKDPSHPLHNFFCRPDCYIPPAGAESIQETCSRAQSFLRERILPLEGLCDNVLLVAHGAFNRCMLSVVGNIPLERFWQISLPNCAASILSLEGGCFTVLEESRVYCQNSVNGTP